MNGSGMTQGRMLYAVTSRGLWEQRSDLATMLGAEIGLWPFCCMRLSSMIWTSEPTWSDGAVGSKPI